MKMVRPCLPFRVILAGGKTGGHIFPAIAMAEEFKRRFPESKVIFVGTKDGLESKIVPQHGFKLIFICARGLKRRASLRNLMLPCYVLKSLYQSLRILNEERPDLVVGTGGYVSFPVVLSARLKNIPTLIQEQNSYPGVSTRILAFLVDRVCLSYLSSMNYFLTKKKLKVIGNPVRAEIVSANRHEALRKFNLVPNKKTIFIFGGSQGAHAINQAVSNSLDLLSENWQLLWQTGESDFVLVSEKAKGKKIKCAVLSFIEDMRSAYAASDLVVSRAGALTLAEICACGKPSLLIPYPFATADHQRYNAEALQKEGAAEMILQKDLTPELLAGKLSSLLSDEEKLKRMAEQSKKMGKPDATSLLVNEMEKLLKKGSGRF
ncbi:MAG: undecaprenyldiphospho-muramoylpentapeptide beta-N-acetylglucosaminyltransferase [candidate division Zixibacteria bacterium]|nr:undecaprenyldiphospho-muramoylpentapeptide beta-N-acetylglucosaminyltransferase [candidate division Zixibacteria bacterium]